MPSTFVQTPTIPATRASRIPRGAWLAAPILALAFLVTTAAMRTSRVRYVSDLSGVSAGGGRQALASWQPKLIVPGNLNPTFEWLDQARQMFATGDLRIRHVDYENAPFGHDVRSSSPYRWWLGILSWGSHIFWGRPLGACLESAALFADPLLYAILLLAATAFTFWRCGRVPAATVSLALAGLYPMAVGFLPGAPDDQGLTLGVVLLSVFPVLAGLGSPTRQKPWFLLAGIAGGIGLWIEVSVEVPILVGIGLGAITASWVHRRSLPGPAGDAGDSLPWSLWAAGGAVACLVAYLIEYFPSNLGSWDTRAVHPLYGLAWLGWARLVTSASHLIQRRRPASVSKELSWVAAALAAVAALPVAMVLTHSRGFLPDDIAVLRLTRLPDGLASKNLLALVVHEGFSAVVVATLLPVLIAVPALWLVLRRGAVGIRPAIAIALGPVVVAVAFACFQLSWWNGVDAALVVLVAVISTELDVGKAGTWVRSGWLGLLAIALIPGAIQAWPSVETQGSNPLVEPEVVGLVERDLARWLVAHGPADRGIVLAPSDLTTALFYYGGIRGLGTLDWENQEGIRAAVRIVSASTADEAFDLVSRRGVVYLAIPAWDNQLDTFARMGFGQVEGSFISDLHRWVLPPWLRPVSYPNPEIGGFEGQSIVVLKVNEDQDDALLMSRIAEYLIETDNLALAGTAAIALKKFQSDIGATVARAQIAGARGNNDEFERSVESILPRLNGEGERSLAWDMRVNLAVVLAQGHHREQALDELQKCLREVDEEKLKDLSPGALYHLEVLCRLLGVEISDPKLRQLALDLLPSNLETRLGN